ncbi:MAG: glycosyltransferase family 39 protein [Pyrinomonadaceae bacterium]|nr:glycosyltransferase family 39 protein [Pyrinomonadaceae bacterium]
MQRFVLAKRAWLLFFLLASAAYFYGLGNFPFVGPDEPRYAEVAREMFMRQDLITPTLGGHTWFEKPALPYWTMMAGYSLFGVRERSARLGFALMGLLTVLVIYRMASRTERADKKELRWLAVSSAIVAASSAGLLLFSHGVNFDIPLTLTTTIALACFFVSELEEETRRRLWLLVGFYAGVGAALLSKGLIGFIITFGVAGAYHLLRRSWPRSEVLLSLLWGVPLSLLVSAVWYAPVIARHGWSFVDEFFIQHHFARYTSNKYHHPQPFYFYIPVILMIALPWTPYLIEALARGLKRGQLRAPDALSKLRAFALCWLIVPIIFFSASGSKLPGYILPALPGAVLLTGERLSRYLRGEGGALSMRACGVLLSLLAVGAVLYVRLGGYPVMACALIGASLLVAGGLLALLLTKTRWLTTLAVACGMFLTIIISLLCGIEGISRHISIAHALEQAGARGYNQAPVYNLHTIERTAEYYAAGRLQYGANGEPIRFEGATQVEAAAREQGGTILVIVPSEYAPQLTTYAPLETETIDNNGEVTLLAVRIQK